MQGLIQPGGYQQEPQQQLQPPAQFDLTALLNRNEEAGQRSQQIQNSPYAFQRQVSNQVRSMSGAQGQAPQSQGIL